VLYNRLGEPRSTMAEPEQNLRRTTKSAGHWSWSGRWRWLSAIALLFAVALIVVAIVVHRAEPTLRSAVIETLSTRFKSRVELDAFHVSLVKGLQVSGSGLRIFGETDPNNFEPGFQPIISVGEFRFRMGIRGLFRSPLHVNTVFVKGLQLNLPPKEHRSEINKMGPGKGKIKIVVDRFLCVQAQLIVNTLRPGKLPLEFDIESLKMTRIGPDSPLHFDATLTNPKPVGLVVSSGSFGPWQPDSPRDTAVSGTYSFDQADLSTIKGIGGTLSSTGHYAGTLDKITVDGATDTPDFRISISGRAVPLHTDFHAIVDGTTGDTYLRPVKAKILNSSLVANGSVVRTKNPNGHHVELDVSIEKGRIEDLLKTAIRTDPPVMTGFVHLLTKFDLAPGGDDIVNRLRLKGNFQVSGAHFSSEKIQGKIDAFSMRSQGKASEAEDNKAEIVDSDIQGTLSLSNGLISFSQLQFKAPGVQVDLTGNYSLDGNQFDYHGKARMDAKLSHMVTGWKSILLKPVDPFFSKNGAGTEVPIEIHGTKSDPHFGLDFGHKAGNKGPIAK
jgi:hypothetical protein